MQQEVALASRVQLTLLSATSPTIPGYAVHARQIPCYEVAGDLYDFTRLDDGRTAIAIGDVTGKGMGAALLMADVIASLRVLHEHLQNPVELMMRLHQHLLRCCDETHYVTLFLGMLDPAGHRLEYVNAGHPPPLMFCGAGEPQRLEATGLPAGLLRDVTTYQSRSVDLPPRGLLCLYSDGISEAGPGDDLYGEHRLVGSVGRRPNLPLEDIADGVLGDLENYLGDRQRDDDVTLLLLRREP
jgi:sigma-B regulation protein RsbU (phosphoserine phosphatase)